MFTLLGRREWVALGALAFAAVVSATFVRADAHVDLAGRTPVVAAPLTQTPGVPTVETAGPSQTVPGDGRWYVRYTKVSTGVIEGDVSFDALDLEIATVPFFYMTDDDWRVEASTVKQLAPGQQQVTVEHTAALRVFVDDVEVASSARVESARQLTVLFEHAGGEARIRIEATDEGGPFVLRWVE